METACCIFPSGSSIFKACLISSVTDFSAGFNHLVKMNNAKVLTCPINKVVENALLKNIFSPTNLQFTVHTNKNCLDSSNALDKYPIALAGKN